MIYFEFITNNMNEILWSAGFFIGWILAAIYIKRIILKKHHPKSLFLQNMKTPINLLILFIGFMILVKTFPFYKTTSDIGDHLSFALELITTIIAIIMIEKIITGLMVEYSQKRDMANLRQTVLKGVIKGIVYVMGALIILDQFGVNISPLIASLGIGTLAVAIALQPMLSNLFSGLSISMDGSIKVGDMIEIESQERGFVIDIGWRASKVKLLNNNIVIVPNSQLVSSKVTNYDADSSALKVYLNCGVHYSSDLRKVESVVLEVANMVVEKMDVADKSYTPIVRFVEFSESSIDFILIVMAKNFISHFKLKHELIISIHERFNKEGIVIPFPLRTLHIQPRHEQLLRELANKPLN